LSDAAVSVVDASFASSLNFLADELVKLAADALSSFDKLIGAGGGVVKVLRAIHVSFDRLETRGDLHLSV
jgi:hypothetical protein